MPQHDHLLNVANQFPMNAAALQTPNCVRAQLEISRCRHSVSGQPGGEPQSRLAYHCYSGRRWSTRAARARAGGTLEMELEALATPLLFRNCRRRCGDDAPEGLFTGRMDQW